MTACTAIQAMDRSFKPWIQGPDIQAGNGLIFRVRYVSLIFELLVIQ